MAQRRPQVVAHRGSSATNAEHTLGAYVAALDEGAEALECDVRLTADGHLVCVHDRDLRRTANQHRVVSTMELAELEQLDFASWKQPWADLDDEAPEMDPELGKVLTLRRLLETVADYPRHVELAIDDAEGFLKSLRNAGAVFVGRYTPEVIGDYVGGSNHVLPTARSARFSSGLSVLDFVKRTSILKLGPEQLAELAPAAMALARAEGLDAHGRSVGIRLNR